ncbi:type IV-A pilus assembly ATPase PilB [Neisseriaceae bacterium PsAf]|nr:type IV-A pilus assembly ATPase PilB [Neisseriaceae bacterium PsAf]MCV2502801.1 type IV-A pilus assembly ATPase PilB [Neisseriaceae bacterium]
MSLGLLNILKRNNYISDEKYNLVLNAYEFDMQGMRDEASSVISYLFDFDVISPQNLAKILSEIYGYPVFDLSVYDTHYYVTGFASEEDLYDYRVLPIFKRGNTLFLAVSDPTLESAYRKLFFNSGLTLEYVLVEDDILSSVFDIVRRESTSMFEELQKDEIFNPVKMMNDDGTSEDGPIAKFINKIIYDAVTSRASDIHFEFYEYYARIRFRMDGVLKEIVQPPLVTKDKIASRIKVMSKLDISEKRIPQDGSMKLKINRKKTIDFRVSTLPTLFGEKIVIRILDNTVGFIELKDLGMSEHEQNVLLEAIHRPYGMILVTGPTGSGKTVTLYNCLNILNTPEVNISTVEDPVEINLPGANQVSMNEKQGLDFARALRSFLRQDPDIIMVGEIRDLETADIALKASQTGHLVFSTLHTNSAPASLTRLTNMGVQAFNVSSSVLLIIAQRLVRKLCPDCKKPIKRMPEEILYKLKFTAEDLKGDWKIYGPVGCKSCKGTGYKGRVGIFEVMPVSEKIQKAILAGKGESDLLDIALDEGMVTLRRSGLEKVKQGITSLDEVTSITN